MFAIMFHLKELFTIKHGISYRSILKFLYPEYISALILYFLPYCIDCLFICQLESISSYAISGIIDNFLTMFLKCAEGLAVATVIVAGYHNGLKDFKRAGQAFVDVFWMVVYVATIICTVLYFVGDRICAFNQFSDQMIEIGIPYLKYKAIAIFFMFLYFALVAFLRAIKNTFVPMIVFAIGAIVFVVVDYALIFGALGMPQLCLLGSAIASIVQYALMSLIMLFYILYAGDHKKYGISLLSTPFQLKEAVKLFWISMPVVLDKMSISFAYAWLGSWMSGLGETAGAAFSCIKMMERFSFVPAIACAQIITFLVSNDMGLAKWNDIHANIKRVLILATIMVGSILLIGSIWPLWFVSFFDKHGQFGHLVAAIFPALAILILIDLLQLILSAALRGAGDVKTVMITRLAVIIFYFIPATYVIHWLKFEQTVHTMLACYAAFLLGNGLMSIVYIYRLKQANWKYKFKK